MMIGMPEVLFRMKVGTMVTLEELESMFNQLANMIIRGDSEMTEMNLLAQEKFPHIFVQPKDEYMSHMLLQIAESKAL